MHKPIPRGLTVDTAMIWLNVSRSYIYRLIRENKLELVCRTPLLIDPKSIIQKIGSAFPKVEAVSKNMLDYQVKQDSQHALEA
mgnify:CR=1 FL=1